MAEMQYASNGKGNLGVTLGAVGTGLGALAGAGGLSALFGQRDTDPESRPVSRYEMGLIQENTLLKAQQYTDAKAQGIQALIGNQAVWNATEEAMIRAQQDQIARLYSLTRTVVPGTSVMTASGIMAETPVWQS